MMNRNTMIAPCSVKKRLYISAVTSAFPNNVCCGFSSDKPDQQREHAAHQERNSTAPRYMMPMRLWSTVAIQLQRPLVSLR